MCELVIEENHAPRAKPIAGPWVAETFSGLHEGNRYCYIEITGADSYPVCSIYGTDADSPREATAPLIRKTPDMRDLLAEVVDGLGAHEVKSPKLRDWFERATRVLAEARGEIA